MKYIKQENGHNLQEMRHQQADPINTIKDYGTLSDNVCFSAI
jgi:hypothetical protein